MSTFLQHFTEQFARIDAHNLTPLRELYHNDLRFEDPLHQLSGLPALEDYCRQLYQSTQDIRWQFHSLDQIAGNAQNGRGYLRWSLNFSHPSLKRGAPICVHGCSYLIWLDSKVTQHRDYFDAGALLYEHVPVLGRVIAWLKGRLA
ncbi:nuclear transport factor 2 family protein [Atopomonas sediminilitoris]|uniref:nuclear transport factor 2 family protein n=1 Tax=Atopomonas sediminilitoris TaxID=2919919 RepID=UPI001F4DCAD2|nr:nuclear transport factor 2 family protein [Atopomonas sediminilitoris]MCJ8168091.1 nuclear transport factor 2 family protein [Atopomonas sediminilitoris]